MDIKELIWHFDVPFWPYNGEDYNLSPRQVIDDPQKYKEEYERTLKADLSYPIDIQLI